jgi:hypothetical protein
MPLVSLGARGVNTNQTNLSQRGARVQAAVDGACTCCFLLGCAQAAYAGLLVFYALQALNTLPAIGIITKALTASLVPLLEVLLVFSVLAVPMALLLLLHSTLDERLTTVPLLGTYMLNGAVTGADSEAHELDSAPICASALEATRS